MEGNALAVWGKVLLLSATPLFFVLAMFWGVG